MNYLYVNCYTDPNPVRDAELQECLSLNKANPLLTVREIFIRPSFSDLLKIANAEIANEDICIFANSDIYFDETLEAIKQLKHRECWALSRWNRLSDGTLKLLDFPGTQDAWIFRGPPPQVKANFLFGVPGCDNRFAKLVSDAGYKITNPCQTIKAIHLHLSSVRRTSQEETVKPPYLMVPTCGLRNGKTAIIQLGRYGDILNILPAVKKLGHEVDWFVLPEFANILDGIPYINPIIWDGKVEDVKAATALATKLGYSTIIPTQVYNNPILTTVRHASFQLEQWDRIGMLQDFQESKLELTYSPVSRIPKLIGYNLEGTSSPFSEKAKFEEWLLSTLGKDYSLIKLPTDLPSILNLLPIIGTLELLITVDTSVHYLSGVTSTPTLVLLPESKFNSALPKSHWIATVQYRDANKLSGQSAILDAIRPKNQFLAIPPSAGTSITNGGKFELALSKVINNLQPKRILESGTYLGQGTTRIVVQTVSPACEFVTIELNPAFIQKANRNLRNTSVKIREGLSIPRNMLPTPGQLNLDLNTLRNFPKQLYADHGDNDRITLYIQESSYPGADDIIGKTLQSWGGYCDLIILDSAGHLGWTEFQYTLSKLKTSCIFALDDINHIKHSRSLQYMKSNPNLFEILEIDDERMGFVIARYTPNKELT